MSASQRLPTEASQADPSAPGAPEPPASAKARLAYAKAFGQNTAGYDQARPGYPADLVSDIVSFGAAPQPRILEVGAGSGQATMALAQTGIPVHCLEPSRRMAQLLKDKCAVYPGVQVIVTTFERWRPKDTYTLLVAAQSWHLVDPRLRLVKAAEVLRPGGAIAVCWHQMAQPSDPDTLRLLNRVMYDAGFRVQGWSPPPPPAGARAAPPADAKPAPPADAKPGPAPPRGGWQQSSPCFEPAPARRYVTQAMLSFRGYAALLATYPEYRAMRADDRQRLLDRLEEKVFAPGPIEMSYATLLHLARRTEHDAGEAG
jgi:SAM-dependent methyltransferase